MTRKKMKGLEKREAQYVSDLWKDCYLLAKEIMPVPKDVAVDFCAFGDAKEIHGLEHLPFRLTPGIPGQYFLILEDVLVEDATKRKDKDLLMYWSFYAMRLMYVDMVEQARLSGKKPSDPRQMASKEDLEKWYKIYFTTIPRENGTEERIEVPGFDLDCAVFGVLLTILWNPQASLDAVQFYPLNKEDVVEKAIELLHSNPKVQQYLSRYPRKRNALELSENLWKKTGNFGMVQEPGRNDLCPCGSGKKYKKCCGKKG